MARTSSLTDEIVDMMLDLIGSGLTNKDMCDTVHIAESTLIRWRDQGDRDLEEGLDTPHAKLAKDYGAALVRFKAHHLNNIQEHSDRDWRASAWLLERKFSDEFGPRQTITLREEEALRNLARAFDGITGESVAEYRERRDSANQDGGSDSHNESEPQESA